MSAVDVPPGLALGELAAGEFAALPRARRLALRGFYYVAMAGAATLAIATRRLHAPMIELLFVAPIVCFSVACVGYAVRRARLRIDRDGVRWGWRIAGVRMHRDRIREVRVYTDAVALRPRRGSTWYLSRRDWDSFDQIARALDAASIPFAKFARRAPLGAKLQGYGLVLDALLLADMLAATLALLVAILL